MLDPAATRLARASAFALFALPLAAQVVRGGDYVSPDFSQTAVFRVSPNGSATVLHSGTPLQGPAGAAVTAQRDVLIADFNAATLFRVANAGGITPVASGLRGPIRVVMDRNGDAIVAELTLPGITRITPSGTRTILHSGTPFQRPFGVAVDGDGTILVADDAARALFRYTPGAGVTPIHVGLPFRLPQGVAVLGTGDYAVMDGLADAVFVVPRTGGAIGTLVATPTLGNPCGIVDDFEGGVAVSESSSSSNRVVRIDKTGQLVIVAQGAPFQNLEGLGRVPTLSGPTQGQAGQSHALNLDLPQQAGRAYVLFASASLYPGISLGADPRHSPCNPDGLFSTSIGANNALFVGFLGQLDGNGQASASLVVPNIPLPPLTLFLQGFAVNFQQPNAIAEFTNVHPLAF